MRKFITLALLLSFACSEETEIICESCIKMTISDALPIQFWRNDCPTYNEKENCGVHSFCWNQKFHCDDEIRIQVIDTVEGQELFLQLLDENGDLVHQMAFTDSSITTDSVTTNFTGSDIDAGSQYGSGNDWDQDGGQSVQLIVPAPAATDQSKVKLIPYSALPQELTLSVSWALLIQSGFVSSTEIQVSLRRADGSLIGVDGIDTHSISLGSSTGSGTTSPFNLTSNEEVFFIGFRGDAISGSIGTSKATVNSFSVTTEAEYLRTLYDIVFTPSELSPEICNEKVQFQIINNSSPDEIAKSDFIEFSDNLQCTQLIKYRNQRNFAGIAYENLHTDTSPEEDLYFYIRVPAVFFHQRFPGEDETLELSDSKIINLNGVMRSQKLFETDYMPYYMHKKLGLILKHQFVEIDGDRWTKQDAYEITEGRKTYPLKMAKIWLTERDFVARNVV